MVYLYLHIFTHIYHKINIPYMDAMDVLFFLGGGHVAESFVFQHVVLSQRFVQSLWIVSEIT